jgi:D-arabinose 1-dehydrogenase-like Zn-dependent alcohol dehydrogenase
MAAKKMRAVQVVSAGGPFELVEREVREPGKREVQVKVQACGLCHSDALTKEGHWPGIVYPRVPGHEIAGLIEAVGEDVPTVWMTGQRVGVGWHGGHDGYCDSCRRGSFVTCERGQIPGITYDGGYADYVTVPFEALALVPDDLASLHAAPLMCAGITTFNALRNSGMRAGDLVAVLGIGGLGHLGVQFAAKMGMKTVAIARGKDKETLARQLGAHQYIDSQACDVSAELKKVGGAKVVLATVTNGDAMTAALGGLGLDGKFIILGAPMQPLQVNALPMIGGRHRIQGWPSGSSIDSEDTMAFSAMNGIRPMIEEFPLERAEEAYARMMSNKARFRVVLTTGN